ncbi:MAG: PorV/PorQ family protein [Elusimicrobia bacterium]|nr:PorV/PorQ family protein [Elusimicrobiota bacterium]
MRLLAALLCLSLAAATPAQASDFSSSAIGTAGSEFLNMDVGPRGIAMGGAYSAAVNDAYSLYWNPAGLTQIPQISATAMHNEYLAGIRMEYLAYAQRCNENTVLAGGLRFMDAGSIDETDINGNSAGYFHPRNYVVEAGWGKSIADLSDAERDIALGVTGRHFYSDMVASADGYSGDVGLQARYTEAAMPYVFSFVAQNLGQGQKFDYTRDTLPFRARFGASLQATAFMLLCMEAVMPVSNEPYGALGIEMSLEAPNDVKAFLRGGYNSINQFSGLEGFRGAAFGFGLKLKDFTIDYSFVPFGMLGDAHRFALSWNLPAKHSRRFRQR